MKITAYAISRKATGFKITDVLEQYPYKDAEHPSERISGLKRNEEKRQANTWYSQYGLVVAKDCSLLQLFLWHDKKPSFPYWNLRRFSLMDDTANFSESKEI